MLRRSAGVANIARGEIIDEAARADTLEADRLRCAYLNVFNTGPPPQQSPLWDLPNVLFSSHNAGASTGAYRRGMEIFLRNLSHCLHALASIARKKRSVFRDYTGARSDIARAECRNLTL